MRPIFNDESIDEAFLRDGYVTAGLLTADQIAAIRQIYDQEQFPVLGDFYLTIWKGDPGHRRMVHDHIQGIISDSCQRLLHNYKPVVSSFAVKQPGPGSAWHPHQDDTFVEEQEFTSLSIWVPLIDTTADNGAMRVLPGSHREYTGPRSPNIPQPFRDMAADIAARLVDIELRAGQAIVFDHRLIHASQPNRSAQARVAVVTVLIPQEAGLIYLYLDKTHNPAMLKQYAISERYYLEEPLGEFSVEPATDKFRLLKSYPYIGIPQENM